MSASDNLSGQQFGPRTLYRGVAAHPNDVNTKFPGRHWTPSFDVAKSFATDGMDLPFGHEHGTVIEAEVHPRDIVEEGSEEWKRVGGGDPTSDYAIFGGKHSEQEVTLRDDVTPRITDLHHFTRGEK